MSNIYQYKSLDSVSSIRLVELLPELRNDELALSMHHADLAKPPTYHALSCCWGDPTPSRTIYIDGLIHPIHENLWRFLKQMWLDKKFRLYWTDALCINQNDVHERSEQVRCMDVVYCQAKYVIVWLGWHSAYEKELRFISLTAESILPGWATDLVVPEVSLEQTDKLWSRFVSDDVHLTFPGDPYWTRTWVLQECILAKEGLVTAGSHSIPLDHFLVVVRGINFSRSNEPHASSDFFEVVYDMRRHRKQKQLWQLLSKLRSKSSDPRDIVYALLGITTVGDSCRPAIEYIAVDYNKKTSNVCFDAILECATPWYRYDALLDGLTRDDG